MRNIGVIGLGGVGEVHVALLANQIRHAAVAAVADPSAEARARFGGLGGLGGTTVYRTGEELIDDPAVEAVIVASPDESHEDLVLACLDRGKPVLCEKPLAASPAGCARVVARELAVGKKLVHVGFMRRHDTGYRAMKDSIQRGVVGKPLAVQCVHRNAVTLGYSAAAVPILNSVVHEIDVVRWLLATDIVRVTAFCADDAAGDRTWGVVRPLLLVLETADGAVASVEVFVNARYGYDVRCEIVGEKAAVSLAAPTPVTVQAEGVIGAAVPADYRLRFADAYREQLHAWVGSLETGRSCGADAWDGYLATLTAHACMEAALAGRTVSVDLPERPEFYQHA
jgi:myo-inositol 2-dehydrogenase/D-chiro-inositol 1-dehydrogenase